MIRTIAAMLCAAFLALPALAQDSKQDADEALTRSASIILKKLPEAERQAIILKLQDLTPAKRRAALRSLIKKHAKLLEAPAANNVFDQLEMLWKHLPEEQRRKMLQEAMKSLKDLAPKERKELLEQYKKFNEALNGGKKDAPKASPKAAGRKKSNPDDPPLRRMLKNLDDLLERHGKSLDETLDQIEQVMGQARDYLELYRSMPKEQREEVLKELEDGIKVFLEENVLPELEAQIPGLKDARETYEKISGMAKEYLEAFRTLPEEERKQLMQDVLEAGKLFFDETIKPEIDREVAKVRKQVEDFRKLPRAERRKQMRKMMGRLFGGNKDRKDRKDRRDK